MSTTVKFGFFLKNRLNPQGEQPIVMTITSSYDRTQLFTGLWVHHTKWNEKTSKVRGRDEESQTLNDSLVSLISLGRQVTNELVVSGHPFNTKTVKDKIKNGFTNHQGVVSSFEKFLRRMEEQIPTKYSRPTLVKYTNTNDV